MLKGVGPCQWGQTQVKEHRFGQSGLLRGSFATLTLIIVVVGDRRSLGQTGGPAAESLSPFLAHAHPDETRLSIGGGAVFHATRNETCKLRSLQLAGSTARVLLWEEVLPNGDRVPYYAISLDGREVHAVRRASYEIKLRYSAFEPLAGVPVVPASATAGPDTSVYIVQFFTQPLVEYRAAIEVLGGAVLGFVPEHAYIVNLPPLAREQVAAMPFVRWLGSVSSGLSPGRAAAREASRRRRG